MPVSINLEGVVTVPPSVAASATVTLPGGMRVQGVAQSLGASALQKARASVSAVNAALAPLSPVFSIIDAVLAVLTFATTVPKVLTQPNKVVTAIKDLAKKCGRLLSLVPQLSVPLIVVSIIDVVIQLLEGIGEELGALGAQEARVAAAAALVVDVPAMGPIVVQMQAQVASRRATLGSALAELGTVIEVVNLLCKIVSLPQIPIDADTSSGSSADAAVAISGLAQRLRELRDAIPLP